MPEPDVQQLPGGGGLTSYSFCTRPLYFAWVFLSYLMPSHFIGTLSLGPSILLLSFWGVPPPPLAPEGAIAMLVYQRIQMFLCVWNPTVASVAIGPSKTPDVFRQECCCSINFESMPWPPWLPWPRMESFCVSVVKSDATWNIWNIWNI